MAFSTTDWMKNNDCHSLAIAIGVVKLDVEATNEYFCIFWYLAAIINIVSSSQY